jgi:hypothetical protein
MKAYSDRDPIWPQKVRSNKPIPLSWQMRWRDSTDLPQECLRLDVINASDLPMDSIEIYRLS